MSFKTIKDSLLSAVALIGGTIVFLFIVYWLFSGNFFRDIIKETFSFSYIADNIGSLMIILFIVLVYIVLRLGMGIEEEKGIEKLSDNSSLDSQSLKSLKGEWFFKKIILFVIFLIIMVAVLGQKEKAILTFMDFFSEY